MGGGSLAKLSPERWSIGIDFGTAFSKVAATQDAADAAVARREIMPLHIGAAANGRRALIVPSAVFLNQDRIYFGPRAIDNLLACGDEARTALQSFKTILGAEDFDRAIDMFPLRTVDPSGAFRLKELIVLYLAYLLELINRAAPSKIGAVFDDASAVRLRYSRPGWIPRHALTAHHIMESLFSLAGEVRSEVADQLLSPEGLPYSAARDALGRASAREMPNLDGGIFEASAVAGCHFVDPAAPNHLMVVDIGAGTADFAGFARDPHDGSVRVLPSSRLTIDIAGDTFDRALMHLILNKAKALKTVEEQKALWRNLLANVRDLKEALFEREQVDIRFRNLMIKCTAAEFKSCADYRRAARTIADVYHHGLSHMAKAVHNERGRRMGVVLAGGGALLPSTIAMVHKTKRVGRNIPIEVLPTTPSWASDLSSEREFAKLFAQMCVAFGTAIAQRSQIQNFYPSERTSEASIS